MYDLRLVAPAVGAWLAAVVLLGLRPEAAYATALVAATGVVFIVAHEAPEATEGAEASEASEAGEVREAQAQEAHELCDAGVSEAREACEACEAYGTQAHVAHSVCEVVASEAREVGEAHETRAHEAHEAHEADASEAREACEAHETQAHHPVCVSAPEAREGCEAHETQAHEAHEVCEIGASEVCEACEVREGRAGREPPVERTDLAEISDGAAERRVPGGRRPLAVWRGRAMVGHVAGRVMAGALMCVAASALGVGCRLTAVGSGPVRALAVRGATVGLGAVVTGDPVALKGGASRRHDTLLVPVRVEDVDPASGATGRRRVRVPVLLLAGDPAWRSLVPSQRVRLTARLATPRHGELLAAVGLVRGPPASVGRPSRPQRWAGTVRSRLRAAASRLPADQRGVLPGLVDGDTSSLDPELADAFATAGLTHLMAVSGENLSLLIGAVLMAGRFTGLGRRAVPLLAGLTVFGFVLVARPSPSVLRAAVMGSVALLAVVTGRERRGVPALCAAVLVLVLLDPELARSYGFVLSAFATAGILVLGPRWRRGLTRWLPQRVPGRLPRRLAGVLAEPLAVAAAAHVACTPILVLLDGEVSLVAVPANLLAAPAVGPATLLGVLAAAVAPVSLPAARVIVVPAGLAVGWITGVARRCAEAPYATIGWPAGMAGAALLTVVLVVGALVLRRPGARRAAAAAVAGTALVVIGGHACAPGWPPSGWRFVACDVGQGDGLVLAAGPGRAVVVDTGPDPSSIDRCLRALRVRAVPLLVLTHPHADHVGGVPGVLRGRAVGTVLISPDSEGEERRLLTGQRVLTAGIGDVWSAGPLTLRVLGPLSTVPVSTRDPGTEVNNASIVLFAQWPGLTALLGGDVETEAQRTLLAAGLPHADVLKVPHHGSSHQDPDFLAAAHARIAVTSVGADNDYGHPAPSTMALLARLHLHAYRTDRDGDIAVVRSRDGPAVVTRR